MDVRAQQSALPELCHLTTSVLLYTTANSHAGLQVPASDTQQLHNN